MTFRRAPLFICSLLGLFLLAAAAGCDGPVADPPAAPPSSPPPPATPLSAEEMQMACHDWADVGCRKNMECASISGTLDECIAGEESKCLTEIQGQSTSCQIAHASAIDRCGAELEAKECSDYCNSDGFCFEYCPYFC